jgi:hypothetical protein
LDVATLSSARLAGGLENTWARKGNTLTLTDTIVAAIAIERGCALLTDNRKDFPMPEVQLYPLPLGGENVHALQMAESMWDPAPNLMCREVRLMDKALGLAEGVAEDPQSSPGRSKQKRPLISQRPFAER